MHKTASKTTEYSKNDNFSKIIKICHNAWALGAHWSCSVLKTISKNTYYLKNDNFSKIIKTGHNPWAIAFVKSQFGSKVKILDRKSVV